MARDVLVKVIRTSCRWLLNVYQHGKSILLWHKEKGEISCMTAFALSLACGKTFFLEINGSGNFVPSLLDFSDTEYTHTVHCKFPHWYQQNSVVDIDTT